MGGARDWIHHRRLAGDSRSGIWVRAEAARREFDFIRRAWPRLAVLVVAAGAVITGLAYAAPGGFVRGLVVGCLSTAVVAMVWVLTLEMSGTAATRMGATAEQWTASELRPLLRAGWQLINHFTAEREIDHLLVGPAGVVVAETKWSRSTWRRNDGTDSRVRNAISQVKRTARQVERWDEVTRVRCRVRPVLFLWSAERGAKFDREVDTVFVDGVAVVYGRREAARWRARVEAADRQLTTEVIRDLFSEIAVRLTEGDEREAARQPAAPSVDRLIRTTMGCFLAGIAAILAMLEPLSHGLNCLATAVGVIGIALGLYVRRYVSLRLAADAWLAGVVGVGALALVLFAFT